MKALLDGDIICHRVGWTTNDLPISIAEYRLDTMIEGILQGVGATDFQIYLTDSEGNFRNQISSTYKANRKEEKPKWLEELKEYIIIVWKAKISLGQEADDALGIEQTKMETETVICSIDKDLLQIPGYHYNFVRMEHLYVLPEEGLYNFYKQLIVGDPTDNVNGCPKAGEVKATSNLLPYKNGSDEYCIFKAVQETYRDYYKKKGLTNEEVDDIILMNARLLYIRQEEEKIWNFPTQPINTQLLSLSPADPLSFITSTGAGLNQSTEHI